MEAASQPEPSPANLSHQSDPIKEKGQDETTDNTNKRHDTTEESGEYITGFKLLVVTASLTITAFLLLLDQSILGTAIPEITTVFQSLPDVGWYTGAYPLASAALQPLSGKLYTHFTAKYTFLAFLFVFELGSLICGVAPTSEALIVGRAIAGLGSSGLMNGSMTIIAGAAPMHKRPLYIGIMLGVSSLGIVMGPLIGGALTEHATWRWCFYINLPIGLVTALILVFIKVPDITKKERVSLALIRKVIPELDLVGFVLFAPAAIMFLLALQFGSGNTHAWDSAVIIGLFIGAAATAIVFSIWEWYMGERAMIPGPLIKQRVVWVSCLVNICLMGSLVVGSNYLPIYFQAVKGMGPTMSGVAVLPNILSQMVISILSGALVSRLGYYMPWAVAGGALAAIGNGLVGNFSPTTSTGAWIGYQIVLGVGRGAGIQVPSIAIQSGLPPHQISIGLAILIFAQNIGASVFLVIATTIFTQTMVHDLKQNVPSVPPNVALDAGGGADAVRALVPPGSLALAPLLKAYARGLNGVFFLLAGLAAVGFIAAWGLGWKSVKAKGKEEDEEGKSRVEAEE